MLWGQNLKVFTDHKNLTQDALGLTSDQVYWWLLLLAEYGPEIVYIKGIHNTIVDTISRLDFNSHDTSIPTKEEARKIWMTFTQCWCDYDQSDDTAQANTN